LSVTINQTPLPDLTGQWSSLSQTCNNTLRGTKCSLKGKFTVQNIGNLDASSSTIKFHLSDNNTYNEGDTLLKQFPSGTIMAGGSLTGNIKFNLPSGQTASGKYVIAVIDADNTVTESNESNNQVIYGPIP
jgi:subtilase family serine protease